MDEKQIKELWTPISVVLASVIVAGAMVWNGSHPRVATEPSRPPYATADIEKVKIEGQPFIGVATARVTIAYWYDYQCPFCHKTETEALPELIREYVNTGKAKIVFKDFQFLGPDSQTAGLAERAVWETVPEQFYAWHKAMFEKQDAENGGWGNRSDVLALTKAVLGGEAAANVERLMTSMESEYQQAMDADRAEGKSFGVSGTPSFIIGDRLIVGAVPYSEIKAAIEAAL